MISYLIRRIFVMIPTLIVISLISFIVIQLPPGDFVSNYISQMEQEGNLIDYELVEELRRRYGLNQSFLAQYFKWIVGVMQGNLGYSFHWNKPVKELIGQRLLFTFVVAFCSLIFTWLVAFPIGLYAATHQYSIGDYVASVVGFLGLSIPNFMLALMLMWISYSVFDQNVGGLFSREMMKAQWSLRKLIDLLQHLWIPVVVVGTAGTAGLIRIFRANLLDELRKQYVVAARTKGLSETRLVLKYPVRVALNPFISTVGWLLPTLISGSTITAVVLSLPTSGPLLLSALRFQDMYLAGSFVLILAGLTVIGTLISDLLLAWVDPRIRYE